MLCAFIDLLIIDVFGQLLNKLSTLADQPLLRDLTGSTDTTQILILALTVVKLTVVKLE